MLRMPIEIVLGLLILAFAIPSWTLFLISLCRHTQVSGRAKISLAAFTLGSLVLLLFVVGVGRFWPLSFSLGFAAIGALCCLAAIVLTLGNVAAPRMLAASILLSSFLDMAMWLYLCGLH